MKQSLLAWLWRHPRVLLELYERTGLFVMRDWPKGRYWLEWRH